MKYKSLFTERSLFEFSSSSNINFSRKKRICVENNKSKWKFSMNYSYKCGLSSEGRDITGDTVAHILDPVIISESISAPRHLLKHTRSFIICTTDKERQRERRGHKTQPKISRRTLREKTLDWGRTAESQHSAERHKCLTLQLSVCALVAEAPGTSAALCVCRPDVSSPSAMSHTHTVEETTRLYHPKICMFG